MVDQHVSVGDNRTSRAQHPEMYEQMMLGTQEFQPTSEGEGSEIIREERVAWMKVSSPVGHMPLTVPEAPSERVELLDKLGERLAFERSGVRLYDGLLAKFDADGPFPGGPSRSDVELIRREEHEHFLMLMQVIGELGGDASTLTPSADLSATLSRGVQDALADPRVNLLQGLEAILVAELADHAAWDTLVLLAERAGEVRLVAPFSKARASEEQHVGKIRLWVQGGHGLLA